MARASPRPRRSRCRERPARRATGPPARLHPPLGPSCRCTVAVSATRSPAVSRCSRSASARSPWAAGSPRRPWCPAVDTLHRRARLDHRRDPVRRRCLSGDLPARCSSAPGREPAALSAGPPAAPPTRAAPRPAAAAHPAGRCLVAGGALAVPLGRQHPGRRDRRHGAAGAPSPPAATPSALLEPAYQRSRTETYHGVQLVMVDRSAAPRRREPRQGHTYLYAVGPARAPGLRGDRRRRRPRPPPTRWPRTRWPCSSSTSS